MYNKVDRTILLGHPMILRYVIHIFVLDTIYCLGTKIKIGPTGGPRWLINIPNHTKMTVKKRIQLLFCASLSTGINMF
jgi:hypothetical protein